VIIIRRSIVAMVAVALMLAPTAIASPHDHTTYGPMAAPNGMGQPAWYTASEWNGMKPGQYGTTDWWITGAPADATPDLTRRSEIKVGTSQAAATLSAPGKKTQWKGWLKPVLGAAKNDGRSWHSLVQLHGPDTDGGWRYAQVALRVENGYWRLWGDDGSNVNAWSIPLMPYVDGYATYAMVTYRADAVQSLACVSLDPAGAEIGQQTWCHDAEAWDSQWVVWHSGLYRGSGSSTLQPTYEQRAYVKEPVVTIY
jgi:hypothetical protein